MQAGTDLEEPPSGFERSLPDNWPQLTLAGLVLVALLLRIVNITGNPPGFFTDEAAAGLDAQAIWRTGRDMHGHTLPFFFENLGDYKLPVFIYSLTPVVGVLGLSEFSVRVVVAVFGVLTVIATYLLARELFRRDSQPAWQYEVPALVAAGLLAILPWHLHYSRTGFGEMVSFPLLFAFAWWLFLRAGRTGSALLPSAIVFALCFYTYRSAWIVVPPFLLLLAALYARDLAQRRRETLLASVVFAIILLPLAYHLLFGPDDRAAHSWIFNVDSEHSTLSLFWEQYRSYFTLAFLFEAGDGGPILRHYLPGHGVLYWFMLPLIVLGIFQVIRRRDRRDWLVLALLFLYPLGAALSDTSPISSRAILGSVAFVLLAALGVQALIEVATRLPVHLGTARDPMAHENALRPGTIALALGSVLVIAVVLSTGSYLRSYHGDYADTSEGFWGWQGGPKTILAQFESVQDQYDELYLEGYFNAPHVFIPFYTDDRCPKCRIGGIDRYDPTKRQLFALRMESPELQRIDARIIDAYVYGNGDPGFLIVEILGVRPQS